MNDTAIRVKNGIVLGVAWTLPAMILLGATVYSLAHEITTYDYPPFSSEAIYLVIAFVPMALLVSVVISHPRQSGIAIQLGALAMAFVIEATSVVSYYTQVCPSDISCNAVVLFDKFTQVFWSALILGVINAICQRTFLLLVQKKIVPLIIAIIVAVMVSGAFGMWISFAISID